MLTHTEKLLFQLILSDNIDEFKEAFSSSSNINKFCTNENDLTLIAFAVQSEAPQVLDYLCQDKELKNYLGPKGTPAVHYLTDHMNDDVLNVLVKHQFNFNELDRFGKNVLHVAARVCEHQDFIRLIRLGADINQRSHRGETPKDTLKRWGNTKVRIREESEEFNNS